MHHPFHSTAKRVRSKKSGAATRRKSLWCHPWLESLEDRVVPSWDLSATMNTYNTAAKSIADNAASAVADQALGLKIPLVTETLSSALNIGKDFKTPFQTQPNGTDWNTVQNQLQNAGFTILSRILHEILSASAQDFVQRLSSFGKLLP